MIVRVRSTDPRRRRRGVALPMAAASLFALAAAGALILDGQLARVVQRRMQSVADSAALEGLRFAGLSATKMRDDAWLASRGVDLPRFAEFAGARPAVAYDPGDASWTAWLARGRSVLARMQADRMLVRLTEPVEAEVRFSDDGLGPTLAAASEESSDGSGIQYGEVVGGVHRPRRAAGGSGLELGLDPAAAVGEAEGLVVRLRRTGEAGEAGSISSGPKTPLLFRRTELGPSPAWSDGLSVLAEGVARTAPVRTVGPSSPQLGLLGAAPFWLAAPLEALQTLDVPSPESRGGTYDPALTQDEGVESPDPAGAGASIGDPVVEPGAPASSGEGYAAIAAVGAGGRTIVGFQWIEWAPSASGGWTLRAAGRIAPENASAVVRGPRDAGAAAVASGTLLLAPVRGRPWKRFEATSPDVEVLEQP